MSMWSEIYDSKDHRIANRDRGPIRFCDKCQQWQGHSIDCSEVTLEGLAALLMQARKNEQHARDRAANYLKHLKMMSGKLAMLKHENNQLRKNNERLSKKAT